MTQEQALEWCAADQRRASDMREFHRLLNKLFTEPERNRIIDLAFWCEDFFDKREGQWAQEAAAVLRKLTNTSNGESSLEET
jgi:hypothetical protein